MSTHVRSEACLHAQRCVQEYVDGTLVAEEVTVVEAHLAACPSCAKCYGLEVGVRTVMRQACDEPCPEGLRAELRRICDDCDCE
jgi:anti-sigma factor (TIGR02949 family)